jgi:hypothetical protein
VLVTEVKTSCDLIDSVKRIDVDECNPVFELWYSAIIDKIAHECERG